MRRVLAVCSLGFVAFLGCAEPAPPLPPPAPPAGDTTPPAATSFFPADGATGVSIRVQPSVTLSEPVAAASLEAALHLFTQSGASIPGAVEVSGLTARFVPAEPLAHSRTYTVSLDPVADAAGNYMPRAAQWSFTTEAEPRVNTPPALLSSVPPSGAYVNALPSVELVFSESVVGAQSPASYSLSGPGKGSLAVTQATFVSGSTWRLTLSGAPAEGAIVLSLAGITDLEGASLEGAEIQFQGDLTPPSVAFAPEDGARVHELPQVDLVFSEPVTGADQASSYSVSGTGAGTLSPIGVMASGATTYRVLFAGAPGNGTIALTLGAAIQDRAGNPPSPPSASYQGDVDPPVVAADPPSGSVLSDLSEIELSFSEPVLGADRVASYTLGGAGAGTLAVASAAKISGNAYRVTLAGVPAGGLVTLELSGVTDEAGNPLPSLSRTLSYELDRTAPTVAEVTPPANSLLRGSGPIVVRFNESVVPATLILGGSLGALSDGGAFSRSVADNDTLTLKPTLVWPHGSGRTLSLEVRDRAGNALSPQVLTYDVDAVAPTATVSPASGSTITATRAIVITFSESMARTSLSLSGTLGGGAGAVWSTASVTDDRLTLTPATAWPSGAGNLGLTATDLAGNPVHLALNYTVDAAAPVATASPASGGRLRASTPIIISFSKGMDPTTLVLGGSMAPESDGGVFSQGTVADDRLTVSPAAAWTEGTGRTLTVDARDKAGNALPRLSLTYTVDATAPTLAAHPESGARIGTGQAIAITFSEAMDPGKLVLGGSLAAEADAASWASPTTVWIRPAGAWTEGTRTLSVSGEDLAGNPLATPAALSYTVDGTPPHATASPASGTRIGPATTVRLIFDEPVDPPTLALSGPMGAESNGGTFSSTVFPNDTVEIAALSGSWSPGSGRALTVNVKDVAGNPMAPLTLTYDVDASVPTATVAPPTGSGISATRPIVILFTESMNPGTLVLGGTLAPASDGGAWSASAVENDRLTVSPATTWPAGARTLTVAVSDLSGTPIAPLYLTYTVDTAAPTATVSPASGAYLKIGTEPIVVSFSESMNPASLVLLGSMLSESDGGSWSSATFPNDQLTVRPKTRWGEGARSLSVQAQDLVGNPLAPLGLAYTVDTIAPQGEIVPASGNFLGSNTAPLVITFSESMDPDSLVLGGVRGAEAGAPRWSSVQAPNDQVTLSPATVWSEGVKGITIDARDKAGHPMPRISATYGVDTIAPTASASPQGGARIRGGDAITVTFSEPMDTSTLVLDGSIAAQAAAPAWSLGNTVLTLSPRLVWTEGPATLSVWARDLAGNEMSTLGLSYTVDTTAPSASATPESGARIQPTRSIAIRFSETMAKSSLTLTGGLGAAGGTLTWSQTTVQDDTVILAPPTGGWPSGAQGLGVAAEDLAGNPVTLSLSYTVDGTAPTATASPANNGYLGKTTSIVITFSESMDTASLALGGSLAPAVSSRTWSPATGPNTRLTLATLGWSEGAGTLTVDARDVAGNSLAPLSLTYTVDSVAPTVVSANPADGSRKNSRTFSIIVVFSETMLNSSLFLSGTLAAAAAGGFWSQATVPNDKVTINPLSQWPEGTHTLVVSATDLAGNPASIALDYTIDATRPTVLAITPAPGSLITDASANTKLTVTFSESMDPSTLVKGGSPSFAGSTATWSAANKPNDKVTFSLSGSNRWDAGTLSMNFQVADLAANYADAVTSTWDVLDGRLYARANGNDANPGTAEKPKASIGAALAGCTLYFATGCEVYVAGGSYTTSATLDIPSNFSVVGGFSQSFGQWNPAVHVTTVTDTRTTGGAADAPLATFRVVDATAVEILGFDIDGPSGAVTAGVFVKNSGLYFSDNTVRGSMGTTAAHGVYVLVSENGNASEVYVLDNTMDGGSGAATTAFTYQVTATSGDPFLQAAGNVFTGGAGTQASTGVALLSSMAAPTQGTLSPQILSNVIRGGRGAVSIGLLAASTLTDPAAFSPYLFYNAVEAGSGATATTGVRLEKAEAILFSSTVLGGAGAAAYGLYIEAAGMPYILSSTIHGGAAPSSIGVAMATSEPLLADNAIRASGASGGRCAVELDTQVAPILWSNDLFSCGSSAASAYRSSDPTCAAGCTVTEMESMFATLYGTNEWHNGNISVDPGFVNAAAGDFRFATSPSAPPCAVTRGGRDLAAEIGVPAKDIAGQTRTAPWSIGAHEFDGTCAP